MRVAWFTPFSSESAIGEYSMHVTNRLAAFCNVDIWTSSTESHHDTKLAVIYYNLEPATKLLEYDHVIYNMGNYPPFHRRIYEVSCQYPGVVILHDRILHHFFADHYLTHLQDADGYLEELEHFYGPEARGLAKSGLAGRHRSLWEDDLLCPKYPFFQSAIVNATGVVTHSYSHAQQVRKGWLGPVAAIPLPVYEDSITLAESNSVPKLNTRLLLVTFGHINPNKRVLEFVKMLGKDRNLARSIQYVVIGPYDAGSTYVRNIKAAIAQSSLEDVVQLLGYQPESILNDYLSRADLFINLRFPSTEGGSASLMKQIARGKPVFVFDTASYGELPEGTVVKIPVNDYDRLCERLMSMVHSENERARVGSSALDFARRNSVTAYVDRLLAFLGNVRDWRPLLSLCDAVARELAVLGIQHGHTVRTASQEIAAIFQDTAPEINASMPPENIKKWQDGRNPLRHLRPASRLWRKMS